jgi:HPt (histidine-containing phosphotransfer) domain-containing protein
MDLIDAALVREQFDALDPATVRLLRDALQGDLREWSGKLASAWSVGDDEAISRARHALKGLCGNFGATALETVAQQDLTGEAERARLTGLAEETIAAILDLTAACAQ